MIMFKKIISFIIVLVIIIVPLTYSNRIIISPVSNITTRRAVKVAVLMSTENVFYRLVEKNLQDIQQENPDKVEFTSFDGKGNIATNSEILSKIIENNYDLILEYLGDLDNRSQTDIINDAIYKAKQKNIPIIFINAGPNQVEVIKSYPKAVIISLDQVQVGTLQGKIIVNAWNTNKQTIDKNGDNILQYIILKAPSESFAALARTKYSVSTINDAGIKTNELESVNAKGLKELAKVSIESLFLRYDGKIEVIISNNDAMAAGAIQALQKYGYNMGDKLKTIPVFGIGGGPEAQDLIKKGVMAGTVSIDFRAFADALYNVGMNLVFNRNPLEGTKYKFDKIGNIIFIPQNENVNS